MKTNPANYTSDTMDYDNTNTMDVVSKEKRNTTTKEDNREGTTKDVQNNVATTMASLDKDQLRYGWFCFTPDALQGLNKGVWVLVFLTVANTFVSATYNGLAGSVQSSIEIRFKLTSTQSSWAMISFDIASIFASLLFAYIGSKPRIHRPRLIAVNLGIAALACALYSLPHFTTGPYEPSGSVEMEDYTCQNRTGSDLCSGKDDEEDVTDNLQLYLIVFIISRVLLSFGVTPVTMIGLIWLDDCVSKETYSFYAGIFCTGWIGGPALGFILGGVFLSMYTDFGTTSNPGFDADDPRWVGAWWMGFIVMAIAVVLIIPPIAGFPIDFPDAIKIRKQKKSEAFNSVTNDNMTSMEVDFSAKDIGPYLKYLFTNWTYVFLVLFVTCDIAIMAGFTAFGPKILEILFNLTPAQAGILFGSLVVPAAAIGSLSGGFMVRRFKLTIIDLMKASIGLAGFVLLGGAVIFLNCPDATFAGVNAPYPDPQTYDDLSLNQTCNQDCWCDDVPFSPVCSGGEVQYFSACHAGCPYGDGDVYYDCECLGGNSTHTRQVTDGVCDSNTCPAGIVFAIFFFLVMVALFMNSAIDMSLMVRSVPASHRVLGFMLYNMIQKFVGAVPAPLIFGIVLDENCMLWQDTCDGDGPCYYYDKDSLPISLYIAVILYKALGLICVILAWRLYKPPKEVEVIETVVVSSTDVINTVSNNGTIGDSTSNKERLAVCNGGFETVQEGNASVEGNSGNKSLSQGGTISNGYIQNVSCMIEDAETSQQTHL